MFGNFKIADIVAYHCSRIDVDCRLELHNQTLVSERDYVTALTTRIRNELKSQLFVNCHAQTANPSIEQQFGVDGIMVFRSEDKIKLGLFEAKYPRVTQSNYGWDYLTKGNVSHFSEQIEKQEVWLNQIAIWEMFFNEGKNNYQSPPYDSFGSSCVWHDNAHTFMNNEKLIFNPWNTDNLKKLLKNSGTSFYSIIYDIIGCRAGQVHDLDKSDNSCTVFSSVNDNISMSIPIPENLNVEFDERIGEFLNENRLDSYLYFDFNQVRTS